MNTVATPVTSELGDKTTGTNSDYGGYSIYGLLANTLGKHPDAVYHGANVDGATDHDEASCTVKEYKLKSTAVGVSVHVRITDPKCPCETVDEAGVHSTADTVYTVGSAVIGSYLSLTLHVYAIIIIIYKISCGLRGGTTTRSEETNKKPNPNKVAPLGT